MDDLTDAIRLAGSEHTVTRTTPAAMVDGYRVAGAAVTFKTFGVEYPLEGDDLMRLPEGIRVKGVRGFICDQPLRTVDAGEPDTMIFDGSTYEVESSEPWTAGNFFRCILVRRP
jgi:hypothetical protein